MKRTSAFFIIFLLILNTFTFADEIPESDIVGESAILIDYRTGEVIWEKASHKKLYPASTTKILTAIIILENHDLSEIVKVSNDMPDVRGARISLYFGETITVEQLMYGLLVESANDAADALAIYHSGSIEAFAAEMNLKAIELGAKDTNFTNPNGLHNANHYSTAYDLAVIAKYCYGNSEFRKMVNTHQYTIPPTDKQKDTRYLTSSNKFLYGTGSSNQITYKGESINIKYDIVDGMKTGYTTEAGNCLISTAQKGNQRYISVVLNSNGSNSVYSDSRTLLDYGFDDFKTHPFITEGSFVKTIQLTGDKKITLNLIAESSLIKNIPNNINIADIREDILIDQNLTSPIQAGQRVGSISYYINNRKIGQVNLVSEYLVSESNLVNNLETAFIKYDEDQTIDFSYYIGGLLKLMLSFIIYRTVVTTYNLRKRKKRLETKNI